MLDFTRCILCGCATATPTPVWLDAIRVRKFSNLSFAGGFSRGALNSIMSTGSLTIFINQSTSYSPRMGKLNGDSQQV